MAAMAASSSCTSTGDAPRDSGASAQPRGRRQVPAGASRAMLPAPRRRGRGCPGREDREFRSVRSRHPPGDIGAVDAGSFIDDVTAPRDAVVVARLQDAGSIYVTSLVDAGQVDEENTGRSVTRYRYGVCQDYEEVLQRVVPGKRRGHPQGRAQFDGQARAFPARSYILSNAASIASRSSFCSASASACSSVISSALKSV